MDDQTYDKMIKADDGKQYTTITRYDSAELRDTTLEMMHVQDIFDHPLELGGATQNRPLVISRRQRRWSSVW